MDLGGRHAGTCRETLAFIEKDGDDICDVLAVGSSGRDIGEVPGGGVKLTKVFEGRNPQMPPIRAERPLANGGGRPWGLFHSN